MLFDEKVSFAKITFNFNMEFFYVNVIVNAIEFYTVSHILSKICETAKTQKTAEQYFLVSKAKIILLKIL